MITYHTGRAGANHKAAQGFEGIVSQMGRDFLQQGHNVDSGHWQALKDVPQTKTIELQNVVVEVPISPSYEVWGGEVNPSLPWAELQFQERVGGEPLNPGETYKLWPWYRGNVDKHRKCRSCKQPQSDHDSGVCPGYFDEPQFSHTYMERFWPRWAGPMSSAMSGIRYRYGDLNDLLDLLAREPYTRQAYLPIFFPEDTGAHHGERIPCTLGYHLMLRDGKLHIFYPIRSCDFLRHFRDDVYMAGRLCQWVIDKLRERDPMVWDEVKPGNLTMHVVSMHVFEGDLPKLRREYGSN